MRGGCIRRLGERGFLFIYFFFGGGGGGGGGEGERRHLNKHCIKAQYFYNLKQQRSANNNGANVPGSKRDYCNLFALAFELALFRFADEYQKGWNGCPRL